MRVGQPSRLLILDVLIVHRAKNRWTMALSLAFATVMRTFLVIISYGCKVPAGIFVPSMAIGASFGRMVGILVQALHEKFPHARFFRACEPDVPCITPGTYAFLGAGAALSGIMHITVSVVVIMFELTGALEYILPTMVGFHLCTTSTRVESLRQMSRSWSVLQRLLVTGLAGVA